MGAEAGVLEVLCQCFEREPALGFVVTVVLKYMRVDV